MSCNIKLLIRPVICLGLNTKLGVSGYLAIFYPILKIIHLRVFLNKAQQNIFCVSDNVLTFFFFSFFFTKPRMMAESIFLDIVASVIFGNRSQGNKQITLQNSLLLSDILVHKFQCQCQCQITTKSQQSSDSDRCCLSALLHLSDHDLRSKCPFIVQIT